jgi:hypothetical protein
VKYPVVYTFPAASTAIPVAVSVFMLVKCFAQLYMDWALTMLKAPDKKTNKKIRMIELRVLI